MSSRATHVPRVCAALASLPWVSDDYVAKPNHCSLSRAWQEALRRSRSDGLSLGAKPFNSTEIDDAR